MFSQCLGWLESKPAPVKKFWTIQTKGDGHSPKILLFEGIIILADLLGNRCLLKRVTKVILCDWWTSILSCFCGCLPFTKSFQRIWLESKWNTPFLGRSSGKFLGATEHAKSLFFRTEYSKWKFAFHFFKAIWSLRTINHGPTSLPNECK